MITVSLVNFVHFVGDDRMKYFDTSGGKCLAMARLGDHTEYSYDSFSREGLPDWITQLTTKSHSFLVELDGHASICSKTL